MEENSFEFSIDGLGFGRHPSIDGGYSYTVALKEDGTVWSWGYNYNGILGDGTTTDRTTPVRVEGLTDITDIACHKYHTLALKEDGTVWAWGINSNGQLGDGTTLNRKTPVRVSGLTNIKEIDSGGNHSMALKEDGTVWTWGYNNNGQLGDGTTLNRTIPVQVAGLTHITVIASGGYHSMALKDDGTVWTWGDNGQGQLGDETYLSRTSPIQVSGLTDIIDIAGGGYHALALKEDGSVWCWGRNIEGQLGDGNTASAQKTPVQVFGLNNVTSISGGNYHTVALKDNGTVWIWGRNKEGQLGDGTTTNRTIPIQVSELLNVMEIACGEQHTIALKEDGTVWSWGNNNYGQLGDGTNDSQKTPSHAVGLTNVMDVARGGNHALALKEDRTVWTWGNNSLGQLGNTFNSNRTIPAQVSDLTNISNIAAGGNHTIALKEDGSVWGWGNNTNGQLGDGTITSRSSPGVVSRLTNITEIACGWDHSIALREEGTVWAWGRNTNGQLGDGTTMNRSAPVQVSGLTDIVAVSGGWYHTIALREDGTVWIWGRNNYGQLGDGTTYDRATPIQVMDIADITSISGGQYHTIVLQRNGTVWGWGYNAFGQLGDGTTINRTTPCQISELTNIAYIAAGMLHTLAFKQNDTVWGWGNNRFGQLGNGTYLDSTTPVRVSALVKIADLACGAYHSTALKEDGTVWSWGYNIHGQIGNGYPTYRPVQTLGHDGIGYLYLMDHVGPEIGIKGNTICIYEGDITPYIADNTDFGNVSVGSFSDHTFSIFNGGNEDLELTGSPFVSVNGEGFTVQVQPPSNVPPIGTVSFVVRFAPTFRGESNGSITIASNDLDENPFDFAIKGIATETPSMSTAAVGEIANTSAQTGGGVSEDGGSSVVARGVCWNTSGSPTLQASHTTDGSGLGDFTSSISGLTEGTTYYVRAYATNSYGTGYGNEQTFKTKSSPIAAPDSYSVEEGNILSVVAPGVLDNDGDPDNDPLTAVLVSTTSNGNLMFNPNGSFIYTPGGGDSTSNSFSYKACDSESCSEVVAVAIEIVRNDPPSIQIVKPDVVDDVADQNYLITWNDQDSDDNAQISVFYDLDDQGFDGMLIQENISEDNETDSILWDVSSMPEGQYYVYAVIDDGVNAPVRQYSPGAVTVDHFQPAESFASIAASMHNLAIKEDGTVWGWGYNYNGQLGDGTRKDRHAPVQVPGMTSVVEVAVGNYFSLALKDDGTVWAWGANNYGQLGDGSKTGVFSPQQVPGLPNIQKIAAGYYHCLALDEDGKLWTWGRNNFGELGNGTNSEVLSPSQLADFADIAAIAAGESHSFAIDMSGDVYAWGRNDSGQVGDGTEEDRWSPVPVVDIERVVAIDGGHSHSLALAEDGTVWAWGGNYQGQLGTGDYSPSSVPVPIPELANVQEISAGYLHGIVLKSAGTVWGWGASNDGRLGGGTAERVNSPIQIPDFSGIRSISAGRGHNIAVKNDGTIWSWGSSYFGSLGNGIPSQKELPVQVSYLANIVDICTGFEHSLALDDSGLVWGWGKNADGQLGLENLTGKDRPVPIQDLENVANIQGGIRHSLALSNDGSVWAWGDNPFGQLGDGTTTDRYFPVRTQVIEDAVQIATGQFHNLALKEDGTVLSWGRNLYGQLGDGTNTQRNIPAEVSTIQDAMAIAAGGNHSLCIRLDGTLWAWGRNSSGQLGDGTTEDANAPVQVADLENVVAAGAGDDFSFAVDAGGTFWSWGENGNGQLGDGSRIDNPLPTPIVDLSGVSVVDGGDSHTLALLENGMVLAWGNNGYGRLGNGTIDSPVVVPDYVLHLDHVDRISAGGYHSLALKNDGTVWSWGSNANGQLGDGMTYYEPAPVAGSTDGGVLRVFSSELPIAAGDAYALHRGESISVDAPGVLENDLNIHINDVDVVLVQDVYSGTLALVSDGSFVYTHDDGPLVSDSFRYKIVSDDYESGYAEVALSISEKIDEPPSIQITEPDGVDDNADASYTIAAQWNGDCTNVFAQFYYDNDNSGADGILIGEIQSDATQIVWNTAQIAEGNYYIYSVVDYGTGNPSVSYSSNAVNIMHGTSPVLEIPDAILAYPNQEVSVPVNFVSNGHDLAAATFSVDFDETCLEFDPTDGDGNGIPDSVTFDVPAGMTASVSYDATDTDGELDFVIMDMFMPFAVFQDGQIAEIVFTAKCTPTNDSIAADVLFSSDPELSFGDSSGRSVEGLGIGGFVEILAVAPGDANNDGKIDAGDISALVLEIFDGDGTVPGDASGGSYAGCAGADSNQDGRIDAADIVCVVLQIFNGPGACGSGKAPTGREPDPVPSLVIHSGSSAKSGEQVEVPIVLSSNGAEIAAATFSIDFDETCLAFDPTDGNGDGIPDEVVLNVPAQLLKSVSYDPSDTDGEIDVAIFNFMQPFQLIPDGAVATVTFTASCQPVENSRIAVVAFSENPEPSFGDTGGQSVESDFVDGGVEVIPDRPFAAEDSWSVDEGATLEVAVPGVMENDLSFEGGDLSASLVDGPAHGDVVLNSDGSFVYTHDGGESESDSFTYQVNGGFCDSNGAEVNIQVEPVNDPPVGVADAYTVVEGEVLEIEPMGVLANDEDEENDPLSARLGQGTVHGTLDLQSDGSFFYTHDGGESETDSFTYFANDGQEDSRETEVTIAVTPYNDPPSIALSEPDVANEPAYESFLIKWTDDDPDDNASVDLYFDTDNGGFDGTRITQSSVGEDDETDRFAWDTSAVKEGVYFVYAVIDDGVNEPVKAYAAGSVEVDHNVAPEAEDDSYSLKEGQAITVAAPGILENDNDDDGDTIQAELVSDAQHGDLTFHADGSFTYEHDGGETVSDSFSYKVSDGELESEPAKVSFQIEPVNDAPEAKDESYEVDEGETLNVDDAEGVLANDEDAEDDSLTVILVEGPEQGSLTLDIDGSFEYVHDGSEATTDSFVYRSFDGIDESGDTTVRIEVSGKNDRPAIDSCERLRIPKNETVELKLSYFHVTDPDNQYPDDFTLHIHDGENYTFRDAWLTPAPDFKGDLLVTVTVSDGGLESEPFAATVTVTDVVNADSKGCFDEATCKPTISEAISHAKSGRAEIVQVMEGVYEENVVLDADILLEVGVSEDLRSVPGENPAIIGNGGEGPSMVIEDGSAIFYNGVLQ